MGNFRAFLFELRRRKVWLVAGVYVVSAWIVAQVASLVLPSFAAPPWVMPVLLILLGLGLPLAVILAWAQETQAGEKAIEDVPELATETAAIAVLPFENMSADSEQEYLADGMVEDIITLLAQIPGLSVVGRNSTFKYKGTSPDLREAGRELGVQYIVEGSVRVIGDRVRVTAQLIETMTGTHLWADNYDRSMENIFEVQDDVVDNIAGALGETVRRELAAHFTRQPVQDLSAWGLTSRAVGLDFTVRKMNDEAVSLLRQAVEKDPTYVYAHAQLAIRLAGRALWDMSDDPDADRQEAREQAALAIGDQNADVVSLRDAGAVYMWLGEAERGLDLMQEAVRRTPSSDMHAPYAVALLASGHMEEALQQLARVRQAVPDNLYEVWHIDGQIHLANDDPEAAIPPLRRGAEKGQSRSLCLYLLASALGQTGDVEGAKRAWTRAAEMSPDLDIDKVLGRNRTMFGDEIADKLIAGIRKTGLA